MSIPASEAKSRLIEGNKRFINATSNPGDVSLERRVDTLKNGQHPYAIVLCCSDSRQVPEAIFSAGIGELFVIRVAGNVVDSHQLGSIEYAADHLDCKLVVVLGHNHCGAVEAAIKHDPDGHIKYITDDIREAIKEEKDEYIATCLNVKHSVKVIEENTLQTGHKALHNGKTHAAALRAAGGKGRPAGSFNVRNAHALVFYHNIQHIVLQYPAAHGDKPQGLRIGVNDAVGHGLRNCRPYVP